MAALGAPAPAALAKRLERELRPMLRQVRATLPGVRSARDARALGVALRRAWPDARIRALIETIGVDGERRGSAAWRPLLRRQDRADAQRRRVPYDGKKLLESWSREATSRITSVRDEIAEAMRLDVLAALEAGTPPAELASAWMRQGIPVLHGTAEGRLRVIAQHQISTLHAQVQSARARAVGVEEFRWRTQGDDRVRAAHRALDGTQHRYDEPPDEGLPGMPVNCRCWAESVIPDAMVAELGLESIFE